MEIYLNNLLAEETIEEQCDPILNLCLKEHTPSLLLSLALLNLLSQFLSVRRNFPSPFSGKNDFTQSVPGSPGSAWRPGRPAMPGASSADQTQPPLLPAQAETASAKPERNRASPKRYSKTARHQAGHTAQGTGPPNTSGRWGRTSLLVLWTEHSRRMYRMLSDNEPLNNKWQVPSPWLSCPSHLSSVYRRLWFCARKHNATLTQEVSCYS